MKSALPCQTEIELFYRKHEQASNSSSFHETGNCSPPPPPPPLMHPTMYRIPVYYHITYCTESAPHPCDRLRIIPVSWTCGRASQRVQYFVMGQARCKNTEICLNSDKVRTGTVNAQHAHLRYISIKCKLVTCVHVQYSLLAQ